MQREEHGLWNVLMASVSLSPAERRRVRCPQFNLRTMLAGVALVSAFCAVVHAFGSGPCFALLLFGGLVTAHVSGNVLGTRLRDGSARKPENARAIQSRPLATHATGVGRGCQRLREHAPLGRSAIVAFMTVTTSVAAGFGGFALSHWGEATPAGIAVGAISSGVVGAIFGFLMSSFMQVAAGALAEAKHGTSALQSLSSPVLPTTANSTSRVETAPGVA